MKGNVAQINLPSDMASVTLLHNSTTNPATTTSSAVTLNLRQSNCDGCTWPQRGNDERRIGQEKNAGLSFSFLNMSEKGNLHKRKAAAI